MWTELFELSVVLRLYRYRSAHSKKNIRLTLERTPIDNIN